ncbi:SOS response-associated peptidase, partial [Salmonella enterica subsp. enterica]|nr:SOS response-associated peptidase [Salmonella enterica subsp. enterica serovar Bareilly]
AAREWMRQGISGKEIEEIITDGAVPTDKFTWHAVKRAVGNVKNQGEELIKPVT